MRYRLSGVNVTLVVLATACSVGVVAFFPDAAITVRLLAGVGVVGLVLAGWGVISWATSKDARRLALFAAVRGWEYRAEDPEYARRFEVFPFGSGLGARAVNVLVGSYRFHDCATFTYVVGRPVPQLYQVTIVEIGATVPSFELFPEDLVAAVTKVVGGQDLRVGDVEFDAHWRVTGTSEPFVREVLNDALMRRLKRRSTRGMPLAVDAGAALTWRAGPVGIVRLSRRLDTLIDVVEAIPPDVWRTSLRRGAG